MASAVAAVVAYVASSISVASIVTSLVLNIALGLIKQKLFPQESLNDKARRITVVIRSAASAHRILYGRVIASGTMVFGEVTNNRKYLHLVTVLAGHEIDAIEDVYLNDKISTDGDFGQTNRQQEKWTATNIGDSTIGLTINGTTFTVSMVVDGSGGTDAAMDDLYDEITNDAGYASENYTVQKASTITQVGDDFNTTTVVEHGTLLFSAKSAGSGFTITADSGTWDQQVITANGDSKFVDLKKHLGTPTQTADSDLVSAASTWTSTHRLRGLPYLYLQLQGKLKAFPTGLPNIKAVMRGRKVFDPRDTPLTVVGATAADPTVIEITSHGLAVGQSVMIVGSDNDDLNGELFVTAIVDTNHIRGIAMGNIGSQGSNYELALGSAASGGNAYVMHWTDNWALCVLDYLMGWHGIAASLDEIDTTSFIAAANTSDEQVTLTVTEATITADDTNNLFTYSDTVLGARTGDIVQFTTTGSLPTGLSAATNYYVFETASSNANKKQFKVATSLANARAQVPVTISDTGSGTLKAELHSQVRYTCNGVIETSTEPADILTSLMTAGAGALVYSQGKFRLYAGVYTASAYSFDANLLRGDIEVEAKLPRRELYNVVRGVFVNPDKQWQATDFPPVKNASYASQDGEEIVRDLNLAFTNESIRAQRIAKIFLEQSRNQITVKVPCNLGAFKVAVGDVVDWTLPDFSWTNKEFRVLEWEMPEEGGIDLLLREESSDTYDWLAGDETAESDPDDVIFPDPSAVDPITGLAASSGTADLLDTGDGNVLSRINVTWDAVTDDEVLEGGHLLISYKLSGEPVTSWVDQIISPDKTQHYISPVQDGFNYDIRIKPFNAFGVPPDDFTYLLNYQVVGKTEPPPDVNNFSVSQNGDVVVFKWSKVTVTDLAGYEIRYGPQASYAWSDAVKLTEVTKGTQITTAAVPPGNWTFGIKAVDTTGNRSTNDTTKNLTVDNTFDVIIQSEQAPRWLGTLTNMSKHYTGVLYCHSQGVAADDGWNTFDQYVPNPEATCSYEAPAVDIGFDDNVRVYASQASGLGPGGTDFNEPTLNIDYKLAAGAYDGFEVWTIGNVNARYVKSKLVIDTGVGVPYLTSFVPVADVQEHEETQSGLDVSAGGETITFDEPFHFVPHLQVSVESGSALIPTFENLSETGFDAHVWNLSGTDVGITGGLSFTATGA